LLAKILLAVEFVSFTPPAYSADTNLRHSYGAGRLGGLMAKKPLLRFNIPVIFIVISVILSGFAIADTIPLMTKEELKARLGDKDVSILDVRAGRDWTYSEFKIMGAIRVEPAGNSQWADKFDKDKSYVLYCA
jgi:hypothetical protein